MLIVNLARNPSALKHKKRLPSAIKQPAAERTGILWCVRLPRRQMCHAQANERTQTDSFILVHAPSIYTVNEWIKNTIWVLNSYTNSANPYAWEIRRVTP